MSTAEWTDVDVAESAWAEKRREVIYAMPDCDECGHAAGHHGEELGVCTLCPVGDDHHYRGPLDEGRCYLCGKKTPRASGSAGPEFTLCDAHVRVVDRLYDLEVVLATKKRKIFARVVDPSGKLSENTEHEEALVPWAVFDDGCIQKDDQRDDFVGDDDAAAYVAARLGVRAVLPEGF